MQAAIRVAAAGLGAAVAGPLGCALGAAIGNALGSSAAELIGTYSEKFGEEAAKKLLDTGTDSLVEKLKKSAPNLESAYRQALHLSLTEIRPHVDPAYNDWFSNWNLCLESTVPLKLEEIQPSQLTIEGLDTLFRRTMERLDAQGTAIRQQNLSLLLRTRPAPDSLITDLTTRLSEQFKTHFRALIVTEEYRHAWKEAELEIREYSVRMLERIDRKTDVLPQVSEDTAAIRRMLEAFQANATEKGLIPAQSVEAKDAEISRLMAELEKLQQQLAARSTEPTEAELSELLKAGDLDGALRLKSQQVERRQAEADKLPRDLYELGTIHELRFEWPLTLAAYRQAWELGHDPDHGFNYARMAQKLNRFGEAIATYESLLGIYEKPEKPADRASTLNNLAVLYSDTQRIQQAERAYDEALAIQRGLAEANPDAYLPRCRHDAEQPRGSVPCHAAHTAGRAGLR